MRTVIGEEDTLQWILSDHLSSASVTANEDGTWNSRIQHTAFGEVRATSGLTATKYRYTGQLAQDVLGLDYYVARFFDPLLGHFISADTIIPDPEKSNAFDRYSYVLNNPLLFRDSSGHNIDCSPWDSQCRDQVEDDKLIQALEDFVAPPMEEEGDMVTVGGGGLPSEEISPAEYALLLNNHGELDYSLLAKMYLLEQQALSATKSLFHGDYNLLNDKGDAFRHAYWSALITRDFGAQFARDFTSAHETGFSPFLDAREQSFMDMHNNSVGIEVGSAWPTNYDDIVQSKIVQENILELLDSGELYVWDGQDIYHSDDVPLENQPRKGYEK
ncbi:MAG: RHS repeat-associated core domain-containing protein [Anaerolineaceae bacterium]